MFQTYLLDPVQILYGSNQSLDKDAVLIIDGNIKAFGEEARQLAQKLNVQKTSAEEKLLAPCLVDPHSTLEDPIIGKNETLQSLKTNAANAGYGQVALLPKSRLWRDSPEQFNQDISSTNELLIHFWGSLTVGGQNKDLSAHADILKNGAVGLSADNSLIPTNLLKKALLIGEIGNAPLLLAPRDLEIQGGGLVRESVETLRAGWLPDPIESETLPLYQLLELHRCHPDASVRIMNMSTAAGVSILSKSTTPTMASVGWWHLVADSSNLAPYEIGWRVTPSIGSPNDRKQLIKGLKKGTLTAIAVNSIALDDAEIKQPSAHRLPGLNGYKLVLPLLWQELVIKSNWSVKELWEALSFGPSRFLNLPEESLNTNSNRWLLFDPNKRWIHTITKKSFPYSANQPFEGREVIGQIVDCGLKD